MNIKKKILVAFLDWGLGHATRCMPMIDRLLETGHEIILAGNGRSLLMMQQQYLNLKSYELPDYNIQYRGEKKASWQILFQVRKIYNTIKKEHNFLKNIVEQENIEIIISDNRYGIYHPKCKNIFLSHQIAIQAPTGFHFVEPFLLNKILKLISKFDELWIPDVEDDKNNLSGKLSHQIKFPIPVKYIGILSRFNKHKYSKIIDDKRFRIIALISGVEPSRTEFENKLLEVLQTLKDECLLICGKVEDKVRFSNLKNVTIVNYLQGEELETYLRQAEIVICRSGYSTVMDLAALGKKAIFIPTPGQTEQEYLAQNLLAQNIAFCQKQSAINLEYAFLETKKVSGFASFNISSVNSTIEV